jgi:hypothetical protein
MRARTLATVVQCGWMLTIATLLLSLYAKQSKAQPTSNSPVGTNKTPGSTGQQGHSGKAPGSTGQQSKAGTSKAPGSTSNWGAPIWGRAARVKARGAPAGHRASQPTSRDDYQSQGRQGGSQCHRRARRWLAKTILAYYRGPENEPLIHRHPRGRWYDAFRSRTDDATVLLLMAAPLFVVGPLRFSP